MPNSSSHPLECYTPVFITLFFCRSSMPPLPSAVTLMTTAAPPSSFWGLWWCRPSWSWRRPSSASCSVSFGSFSSFSPSSVHATGARCWTGRAGSTPGSERPQERCWGWASFDLLQEGRVNLTRLGWAAVISSDVYSATVHFYDSFYILVSLLFCKWKRRHSCRPLVSGDVFQQRCTQMLLLTSCWVARRPLVEQKRSGKK